MDVCLFASTHSEVHMRMLWFRLLDKQYGGSIRSSEAQQHIISVLQTTHTSSWSFRTYFSILQNCVNCKLLLQYFQCMFLAWFTALKASEGKTHAEDLNLLLLKLWVVQEILEWFWPNFHNEFSCIYSFILISLRICWRFIHLYLAFDELAGERFISF